MRRHLSNAGALLAVVVLSGCSGPLAEAPRPPYFEPAAVKLEPGDILPQLTLYNGWWSTPAFSADTAGLPLQVALVRSGSGRYVAGYDRASGTLVAGENIDPPTHWPEDSVIVLDASTGLVWDHFRVDEDGLPAGRYEDAVSVEQRFPPIAGNPPPGTLRAFTRNGFTGAVIYVGAFPAEDLEDGRVEADW